MGFYGKPSGGCDECRARKIRCDQTKPTCRQCAQSKLKCPGYRDLLTVVFRDQSKEVIQRATRSSRWPKKQQLKARASTGSPSSSSQNSTSSGTTPPTDDDSSSSKAVIDLKKFPLMVEPSGDHGTDEAICFFLNNFSWQCSSEFFNDWQRDPSIASRAVVTAASAVGFGNLSAIKESPAMRRKARDLYATALQLTNKSLSDETVVTSDLTFAAIILLSLFETITYKDLKSKNKWLTHVDGCTLLAGLRGVDRLLTASGVMMFMEWRGQLIVGALQRGIPVPSILNEFGKKVYEIRPGEHKHEEYSNDLLIEVANLRAAILANELTDQNEILTRAYAVEAKLEAWFGTLPDAWKYDVVPLPPNNAKVITLWGGIRPYGDYYHKYPYDLIIMNGWCNYRVASILVQEIVLNCLKPRVQADPSDRVLLERCRKMRITMHKLATDICASVPHLFGILEDRKNHTHKDFGSCIGGYMLLIPLLNAGYVESLGHPLRDCVIESYTLIAHSMGIDHALSHIDVLQTEGGVCTWLDEYD